MKIIFLYFLCCLTVSLALPLVQESPTIGSFVGEIVVDSGFVDIARNKPQRKTNGPSASAFQAGAGFTFSSGGGSKVGEDEKKLPVQSNGFTKVFNHEAAISEFNA